jgi:hypothetical protein
MTSKFRSSVFAVLGLLLMAIPALAHHAPEAEFDVNKTFTVTGVLTKVDWINPHIYWYMDAKDANGNVESWTVEGLPPGLLHRGGVTRDMLKVGEVITTTGMPAKDGTKHLGFGKRIKFSSDGHELTMWLAGQQ